MLTIECAKDKNINNKRLKRWTSILLEITFGTQVLIVVVYWLVLHKQFLASPLADDPFVFIHMHIIHSLPFITVLLNIIISKTNFIPSHCVYFVLEGFLYSIVNYLGVRYRGHVLYPFMKWDDFSTVIVCFFLLMFGAILF